MDENGEEVQPEVFREEHRLAFHVALIAKDVTIVPRGAYIVDATHQVIKNKSFEGLSYEAAGQLRSYFHFRSADAVSRAYPPFVLSKETRRVVPARDERVETTRTSTPKPWPYFFSVFFFEAKTNALGRRREHPWRFSPSLTLTLSLFSRREEV